MKKKKQKNTQSVALKSTRFIFSILPIVFENMYNIITQIDIGNISSITLHTMTTSGLSASEIVASQVVRQSQIVYMNNSCVMMIEKHNDFFICFYLASMLLLVGVLNERVCVCARFTSCIYLQSKVADDLFHILLL